MTTSNQILDILIKAITILSGLFLFLGIVQQAIYYGKFGINIFEYSSITEVGLSFVDSSFNIIGYLVCVLAYIVVGTSFLGVFLLRARKSASEKSQKRIEGFEQAVDSVANEKKVRGILFLAYTIILLGLLAVFFGAEVSSKYIIFFIFYFSLNWGYVTFVLWLEIKNPTMQFLTVVFFSLIGLTCLLSFQKVHDKLADDTSRIINIKDQARPKGVQTIITNSKVLYLGKTDKWVFIYHKLEGVSKTYRSDDVRLIVQ